MAPRPIITPAHPACKNFFAVSAVNTPPLPITGILTVAHASATAPIFGSPLCTSTAARACNVTAAQPQRSASLARRAPNNFRCVNAMRVLSVTGILTLLTAASNNRPNFASSFIKTQPAPALLIFLTGHPAFKSTISAPQASAFLAASAIVVSSDPKICIETGCSLGFIRNILPLFSLP